MTDDRRFLPYVAGGNAARNAAGGDLLRDILTDLDMTVYEKTSGNFKGGGFEVVNSTGYSAVFDKDLNLQYFGHEPS